jgi:hypothetical protein
MASSPSEAATPAVVVGAGSIQLAITHGKARYAVRCEAETSVLEVKRLLQPLCKAPPAQQRLVIKGRQASEPGASLASLGLGSGGKVMLLIGEAQHAQGERRAARRRNWDDAVALVLEWTQPVRSALARLRVPARHEARGWVASVGRGVILFFASLLPFDIAKMVLPAALLAPREPSRDPSAPREHDD